MEDAVTGVKAFDQSDPRRRRERGVVPRRGVCCTHCGSGADMPGGNNTPPHPNRAGGSGTR